MTVLVVASLGGCRSPSKVDPAATWQDIRNDFIRGNLAVAHKKVEQARRDASTDNSLWGMKFRLLDAEILTYQGRRPEVISLLNSPGILYPKTGDLAIQRNLLCGMADAKLGNTQQSEIELQEALRLSQSSHSRLTGEVLQAQAVVAIYRNQLTEGADLSQKSLRLARAQQDAFLEASNLTNLGFLALRLDHYDEAVSLLNGAADVARPIHAQAIIQTALENMGVAYANLGDFEKALANFLSAEQAATQIGAESAQIDALWGAGSAYYKLGHLEDAAGCYQKALKGALAIHSLREIAGIHTQLAYLFYQERQFDAAKTHSTQAILAARTSGDKYGELEPLVLQALLVQRQPNGQDAERTLMKVYRDAAETPSVRWEIENALGEFYAGKQRPQQAELWYQKSIRTFETQRMAVKDVELRLPFFANGDKLYTDYADFLIRSRKQQDALRLLDLGRAKTLAEAFGSAEQKPAPPEQTVDAQAVARRLNATILFYSLGVERSYLWAVTAHGIRLFDLAALPVIEGQVRAYQKAILRSSDPVRDTNETGQALYATLVEPAAGMIPKGSKVYVISDGVLNELNFETLLTTGEKPHYWIEDVTLSNANSIRMLSRLEADSSTEAKKRLLLIGNPTTKGTGYETLLNAFAEIRGVEKHFPAEDRRVVTQSEAVPASYVESKPDHFSYIHFVAHGTASRLSPLDSAVVLSPSPDSPDNFKLYARDIMRYPLHARLVTISACYGSGLRSYAGEGLVGLSWAFLRAGSHNVIGALWEVNDASTPMLMDRLYAELEAGSTPDAALRAAKLSLMHSAGVYRKPLYWGGFQLFAGS